MQRAAAHAARHDLQIASLTLLELATGFADPDNEERPCLRSQMAAAIHAAAAVGATVCTFEPPRVADAADPTRSYRDALNSTYHLLMGLREEAEAAGLTFAVRAPWRGVLRSPVELRELVDSVHAHCVGVCVDARALGDAGSLDDWLGTLRHRVVAVRLADTTEATLIHRDRWPPDFWRIESAAAEPCLAVLDPDPDPVRSESARSTSRNR